MLAIIFLMEVISFEKVKLARRPQLETLVEND